MASLRWILGLAGVAVLGCLSQLDERKLAPGTMPPAGGSAGTSSGAAGQGGSQAATGGSQAATGGGGASAGNGSGGTLSGTGGQSGSGGSGAGSGGTGAEAGGGSGEECTEGLTACDGGCVDTTNDNANCGTCGRSCTGGSTCVGGECACSGEQELCDEGCVNTQTDAANCGQCGEECPADQSCVAGECACSGDLTACSDGCVDTDSNSAHCGGCEDPCDAGQVCSGGTCAATCSGSEVQCGNDCADTSSSSAYCGNCETECTGVDVCVAGECVCPDMQTECDGRCIDTTVHNAHCGACDRECSGGTSCVESECRCPQGQDNCDGTCTNLMTDEANCGVCGHDCGSVLTCEAGECRCPPGEVAWNGRCFNGTPGCNTQRSLQNGSHNIQSGGLARSFVLRAPNDYDSARPYRLVFAYHALGTTAAQVDAGGGSSPSAYYGHWSLAQGDTIFVAPQSYNNGSWTNEGNRDVVFTDDILAAVGNALCIDRDHIFATGFSAGAGMPYALACARPFVFRAVAAFSNGPFSACIGGTSPSAYYASHGINDTVIAINEGRKIRDKFVQLNGCTPQTPPEPAGGSRTHICTTYSGCSAGHMVEWCAFDGDHTADPRDGGQSTGWNAAQSWAFIQQF